LSKIFLVGLPGAGKSHFASILASRMNYQSLDLDQMIVEHEKKSIHQIFKDSGEEYFRVIEQKMLNETFQKSKVVVATGGGTPCFFNNMEMMNQRGITIFLDTPIAHIHARIKNDQERPLLQSENLNAKLHQLYRERVSFYRKGKLILKNTPTDDFAELLHRIQALENQSKG
jgi:shikimate kinase